MISLFIADVNAKLNRVTIVTERPINPPTSIFIRAAFFSLECNKSQFLLELRRSVLAWLPQEHCLLQSSISEESIGKFCSKCI